VTLGVAGVVLAAVVGVGAWLATSGDDSPPQDTHSTSTP
jgi:serine/threonine protein kinase, bacterial